MRDKIAHMPPATPQRLPPLHAVRAFAAAARHLSFTRAAMELHVTHSAISRQVRALEDHLGVALFERRVRQVLLTPQGQQFFAQVEPALAQIGAAAQALATPGAPHTVTINVRPSFAVRWVIPRLPGFVAQCPDIEPNVVTSTVTPDHATAAFDVAIRRGLAGWPAAITPQPFLHDQALVVGTPALWAAQPVRTPRDLAAHVLLRSRSRPGDWDDWKRQVGAPRLQPASQLQFDHQHFVLQAALDGLGFALAPASLVAQDLAAGRLACPLPGLALPLTRHYYGLAPQASPQARRFVAWLEQELQAARTAA
jgi:LysR family transcriptional regulator, glycine cleavage system transcriptional activator